MCQIASLYFLVIGFYLVSAATECALSYGYVYYPEVNVYYKFYRIAQTWADARLHCLGENATLVVPKNEPEFNIVKRIFAEYPENTIIGATYPNHLHLGFHEYFGDGDFLTEKEISMAYFYRDFENGEPDDIVGQKTVTMYRNGKNHDYPNFGKAAFICQKEERSYIDELDEKHNLMKNFDPAYLTAPISGKRFKLHLCPKTWEHARSVCYAEGGHLAIIESKEDETFLVNMMNDPKNKVRYAPNKDTAFIGYHDYFTEGQFLTVTGKIVNSLKYVRWGAGEPNGGTGENCVCMRPSGEIHDLNCTVVSIFFCELPPLSDDEQYQYAKE